MSNLRIKNKKLKKEIERLKGLLPVSVTNQTIFPTTLGAKISFDGYEFNSMSTSDRLNLEEYIRRRLVDKMSDELIEHMLVESSCDIYRDVIIFSGQLEVIDYKGN